MKRSIGKRLFIQIMAVLLVFITIAIVANTVLLKPIYNTIKKNGLVMSVHFINSLNGDYENSLPEILKIEEELSARIIIYNDKEIVYVSAARFFQGKWLNKGFQGQGRITDVPTIPEDPNFQVSDLIAIMGQFIPKAADQSEQEFINDNTSIINIQAENGAKYLMLETTLDDGMSMLIVSEMQSLNETVRIFNLFLLGTAGVSMILIIFMTYFMSKRFVKPIRNMNDVTKKIAELDFSTNCEVKTKDELQELGENINALSGSLETTIGDLKKELENAKRLEELRKRFISTVSHELKTPISLMQGYAIGLSSDVCDEKERRDYYAQVIAEESERLGVLVNELMDLTQLEAGYITLHEVEFELYDFLEEIVQKFQAANPEINLSILRPKEEAWCRADVRLMERVAGNYLSNAVRHVDEKKEIKVEIKDREGHYSVTVTNSGKHIPEDKLDEIWNSFYRVDDARNRAEGGHGLGLSIVKNIQIAHGMPCDVKNIEGGVEFSFGAKKAERPE